MEDKWSTATNEALKSRSLYLLQQIKLTLSHSKRSGLFLDSPSMSVPFNFVVIAIVEIESS